MYIFLIRIQEKDFIIEGADRVMLSKKKINDRLKEKYYKESLLLRRDDMPILKIKCREYNACNNYCLECDLMHGIKCNKTFDFETPKKFIRVDRRDCCNIGWNECPSY